MSTNRDEAIKAIEHVEKMLTGPELDPLGKKLCLATLEHAKEEIALIQEVKKRRKVKAPDA
jgi:hypothetical protein